jgi:hypothetical protein
MNLIGKIFVVIIFVLSLVFMSFAIAMYSAHQNWREIAVNDNESPGKPLGLLSQLNKEKKHNEELKADLENLTKERDAAKNAREQAVAKLQAELEIAKQERERLEKDHAALEKRTSDAEVAMNATQTNATKYREERDKLRAQLVDAQKDRDEHFKEVVRKTDSLNQAINDRDLLRKREKDLANDLAKARDEIKWFNLPDPNSNFKSKTPPKLDGLVTSAPGEGLVEISLGSDAGLQKGHKLHVVRYAGGTGTLVGQIEVLETQPDKSVCKIDPSYQKSNVMKGDRVETKIE